ncbi:transcription initiation factor TFIID subunit 5-like isoform X2 [Biomphalaria glabrata]|uniref:Transcription initiation factor TFIID subunit 5 n=1 Tax=Biomphalaria glabrata TaxID=6526 RepID=A0A9W2Z613_BIOGL|nr:transcription initiation factor TFIID subunit 5-like isoform X2 [Biomphalaria glabrata]
MSTNLSDGPTEQDEPAVAKYDKQTLFAVLQFLQKHNLKETEQLLKQEAKVNDDDLRDENDKKAEVSQALAAVYKSDDDPSLYEDLYKDLKTFIDSCLDVHKVELSTILYPIFVHMYLELVYNNHEWNAAEFYAKFWQDQDEYYHEDLSRLACVRKKEHMNGNQLLESFKTSKFVIRMSRDSYTHLKRHFQEKRLSPLLNIIQDHLFIDVFDGVPRTQQQIQATYGGILGEAEKDVNKAKVFYGLLKEPDVNITLDEEEEAQEGDEKPKKKKSKKDPSLMKKSKNDPNAPPVTRIPLPELVTSVDVSDDTSLLAAGFSDGNVRVWSLTPNRLREMKDPEDLDNIDKEADDVMERIFDDKTASDNKLLIGHKGAVFAVSFSPDRAYLLSSSDDGTIRLWSLLIWTNLVCYKGHNFPVWDVKFSSHGYYFASAGHDRTARVWATDHYQPVRIFAGHLSDVDCCQFHPNSNYVATGSSDKTVRLWDMLNGSCVRVMTGHKNTVHCLQFSPDGRYLAGGGADRLVLVWDLASGAVVAVLKGHTNIVCCLCFSRDGTMLASGGLDDSIRLWDMQKIFSEQDTETDTSIPSNVTINDSPSLLLATFFTKTTTVMALHFTRRNLLIGCGPFISTS